MMLSPRLALYVSTIVVTAAACSAKPTKTPDPPTEQTEAAARNLDEEVPPLQFLDEAPAATLVESQDGTSEYQIGSIRLIHKLTPASPVVATRLYIIGGQRDLTPETAGLARLSLTVATTGGTQSTPKDAFHAALDATGSAVWGFTDRDFNGYGLKTLVDNFDRNWTLFEEAVIEPAFPEEEIELRRTQHLAEIASLFEDPDSHLGYVAARHMFAGHPYHELHIGTEENVRSFDRAALLAYQREILAPERLVFVVVGNVPAETVIERIRQRFGRLAPRGYDAEALPPFASEPGVHHENRELPTHYILGYFPAPQPGHDDYAAMLVAVDYLRERLFEEVRTKRNLTYAVSSGMSDAATNYGFLYVTAVDPAATLPVMYAEIAKLKREKLSDEQLEQTVSVFITKHYMDLEQNGSQAQMLANAEIVGGDWKRSARLLETIRAVSPADIQRAASRYFGDYRFSVVGPGGELPLP